MSKEKVGIKETRELFKGLQVLSKHITAVVKDGVDWQDGFALATRLTGDAEGREALVEAARGISQIPEEAADLDAQEVIQILGDAYGIFETVRNELSKKE